MHFRRYLLSNGNFRVVLFFAGYLNTFSHCVIVTKPLRTGMRSHESLDTNLGSVANMEVAKAGQWPDSLSSWAVGMVQASITQGELAVKIGLLRKTVNK